MCGILGVIVTKSSNHFNKIDKIIEKLYFLSESRGKEASGFAMNNGKKIRYLKTPFTAGELVQSKVFKEELTNMKADSSDYFSLIGHSRLVTDGYEHDNDNNQPVVKDGMVVVHNGIIVNSADLWKKNKQLVKNTNLDSELIPSLISHYRKVDQGNLAEAVRKMYKDIYGMTSTAIYFDNIEMLLLATNNGSLYYAIDPREGILIFGSERLILQTVIDKTKLNFFNT